MGVQIEWTKRWPNNSSQISSQMSPLLPPVMCLSDVMGQPSSRSVSLYFFRNAAVQASAGTLASWACGSAQVTCSRQLLKKLDDAIFSPLCLAFSASRSPPPHPRGCCSLAMTVSTALPARRGRHYRAGEPPRCARGLTARGCCRVRANPAAAPLAPRRPHVAMQPGEGPLPVRPRPVAGAAGRCQAAPPSPQSRPLARCQAAPPSP